MKGETLKDKITQGARFLVDQAIDYAVADSKGPWQRHTKQILFTGISSRRT